jgi:hypothetical protein
MSEAAWKKGVEDANRIAQRFEAENVALRKLIAELVGALDVFADADDSAEMADLIRRGKEAGR